MPDALLEDPTRVVELLKSAIVEAITRDAPVGVVEDHLLMSLRISSVGAERLDRQGATAKALAGLQGLRGREEISAALEKSAASGFDDLTGKAIERLRGVVDALGP